MNKNESMLLEAVKNMLSDTAALGLSIHGQHKESKNELKHDRYFDIENKFKIKINSPDISMFDSISSAFHHTNSYKNPDDPQFDISFKKQMDGMVVPDNEQELALKYLDDLRKELSMRTGGRVDKLQHEEFTNSAQQSAGLADQKDMAKATGHEA